MRKKLIALLLCGVSIMSLSACSVKLTMPDGTTKVIGSESEEDSKDDEDERDKDSKEEKESKKSSKSSKKDNEESEDEEKESKESSKDLKESRENSKDSKNEKSSESSKTSRNELVEDDKDSSKSDSKKSGRVDYSSKKDSNDTEINDRCIETDDEVVKNSKSSKESSSSRSDFWSNPSITVEGKDFTFPVDYSEVYDLGFDFDLSDYEEGSDLKLEPHTYTFSTIRLENDSFNEDMFVYIGLLNDTDSDVPAKECEINSLSFDILYGTSTMLDDVPQVYVNGIGWGATAEDCFKAFGEPYYEYESDTYTSYTFRNSEGSIYPSVDVTVHNEYGVVEIGVDAEH